MLLEIEALEKLKQEKVFIGLYYKSIAQEILSIKKVLFYPKEKRFETRMYYLTQDEDVPEAYHGIDLQANFEKKYNSVKEYEHAISYLESIGIFNYDEIEDFLNNYEQLRKEEELKDFYDQHKDLREEQYKRLQELKKASYLIEEVLNPKNNTEIIIENNYCIPDTEESMQNAVKYFKIIHSHPFSEPKKDNKLKLLSLFKKKKSN